MPAGAQTGPDRSAQVEKALQERLLSAIRGGIIRSAHDVSDGGLLFCLAESCLYSGLGVKAAVDAGSLRPDQFLLSETPSRVVVSIDPRDEALLFEHFTDVPVTRLGVVGETHFGIDVNEETLISMPIQDMMSRWESGFEKVFRH